MKIESLRDVKANLSKIVNPVAGRKTAGSAADAFKPFKWFNPFRNTGIRSGDTLSGRESS